jgi:AcrR family transcriptional regulator
MNSVSGTSMAGRPRDPGVDERVAIAAVEIFGDVGWAGFSVEAVARRAGVGKASIYLRWPAKEALLASALRHRAGFVSEVDTGTVRGDLVQLARQLLSLYLGGSGRAVMRIGLEAERIPWIAEHYEELRRSEILAARAIVRRGIRRGELPAATSVTVLLDALCGGAMMHVMTAPPALRDKVAAGADAYAEQLVDFLLTSAAGSGGEGERSGDPGHADRPGEV